MSYASCIVVVLLLDLSVQDLVSVEDKTLFLHENKHLFLYT